MSDGFGRGGPFSHLPTERDYKERVAALTAALEMLVGDVEAYQVSCSCSPPTTEREVANLARAKALLGK